MAVWPGIAHAFGSDALSSVKSTGRFERWDTCVELADDSGEVGLGGRIGPERAALLPGQLGERLLAHLELLFLREEHQL